MEDSLTSAIDKWHEKQDDEPSGPEANRRLGGTGAEEKVRRPWTREEDERLKALAVTGLSLKELSHELGRSLSSTRTRASKLRVAIARDLNGTQKRASARRWDAQGLKRK